MRRITLVLALLLTGSVLAQHDHDHEHGDAYFDSGSSDDGSDWLQTNDTFSFTFDHAGTFDYHCHPHPQMAGTIVVEGEHEHDAMDGMDKEGTEHPVRIVDSAQDLAFEDWGFEPATLTIQVGDTVTWTNAGEIPHTVTANDPAPHSHDHEDAPGPAAFLAFGAVALLAGILQRRR